MINGIDKIPPPNTNTNITRVHLPIFLFAFQIREARIWKLRVDSISRNNCFCYASLLSRQRFCYSYRFPLLFFFIFWINGWNEHCVRQCWVNLLLAIKGEMQFTWIILPERSRSQRYAVQACRIIPIFLALRWKFSTRRSLGTCAVCFVITRRIPVAIFAIGAIAFLLRVAAAIAIFLARLLFGWWRVVVVVDGRVVVFWEKRREKLMKTRVCGSSGISIRVNVIRKSSQRSCFEGFLRFSFSARVEAGLTRW